MRLLRRIRLGLLGAGLVLVAATGWRAATLADASAFGAQSVALEVDTLGGGVLVEVEDDAVLATSGGRTADLGQGPVTVDGTRLTLDDAGVLRREVLRRDWAVYAHPREGFRRIDVGPDPVGRGDGVRDRVVVPALDETKTGWFHLAPPGSGAEPRFRPEDRAAWVVAEQDGIVVSAGGIEQTLPAGGRARVSDRFSVRHASLPLELEISWQAVRRAEPVLDAKGRVQGYRDTDGVDFVVTSVEPTAARGPRRLLVALPQGERAIPLGGTPLLLHGRRDQLRPFRRGVLPERAADRQLEQAVAEGLDAGWITVGPARTEVAVPADGDEPAAGMTWALSRSVVQLLDGYDRARSPVALRLGPGVTAAAAECDGSALRFDPTLEAWTPADRPFDGVHVCRLPVSGPTWIEAGLPAAWREADGDWTSLPGRRGRWSRHALVPTGDAIEIRLDGRPPQHGADRLAATIAGGPPGTTLVADEARSAGRAFGGWMKPSADADAAARAVWSALPGDRWRVEGAAPAAHADRPQPVFVRLPIRARTAGWLALDLALPGAIVRATWNGGELEPASLPEPEDSVRRLSLKVHAGINLLALQLDRPPTAPSSEAGGARFLTDVDGTPRALAEHVADRRARRSVRRDRESQGPIDIDAADAPSLRVDRGIPGLPAGTRWQLSPARGRAATAELVLAAGPGVVARSDLGALVLTSDGLEWHNGPRLTLGGVRRVDTDPDGPPVAGFKVRPGTRWELGAGRALSGPELHLTAAACRGEDLAAELIVVHDGRSWCVDVVGKPRWHAELEDGLPATRIRLTTDGSESLGVASTRPGALWTVEAQSASVAASPALDGSEAWPDGAWLVVPGTDLRLRRTWAEDEASLRLAAPATGHLTIDDDLQASALRALDRAHREPVSAPDTHALRGAVLLLDPVTGDVLGCAARDRQGNQDPSACWTNHDLRPGSTFKVATAASGLTSTDPVVRRLLQGSHPAGLSRTGGSGSLADARLPRLPRGSGADRSLRTRLRNFRGRPMASDLDLGGALRGSINTWFGYAGLLMHRPLREGWGDAGIARAEDRSEAWPVFDVASAAGFGRTVDLGLGVRGTGGVLPIAAPDSDAEIAAWSIGQGSVRATPLGIGALIGMVATDGSIVAPRLDPDRPVAKRPVLDPPAAAELRTALGGVVSRGTAARAFADHPWRELMIGKTGSAERVDAHGLPRTDSWFAGAVLPPSDLGGDPVVIVVVLPGGGLGGRFAAEVADAVSREVILARGWDQTEEIPARW